MSDGRDFTDTRSSTKAFTTDPDNADMPEASSSGHAVAASKRERLWSAIFLLIIGATLSGFLVGQGSNAGTSVYLDRTGASIALAGTGALFFSIAAACARIVGGPIIDNRGRRIVMVAGAVIMLCGTTGPLLINNNASFIFWRILQGIGFSALTTASATAAADVLPASRLGEGIGYYGLGQAISMSIGPALAIFLISTDLPENFYLGLSACAVLALLFSLLCRYEKHPSDLPATAAYRVRFEKGGVEYEKPHDKQQSDAKLDKTKPRTSAKNLIDSIFEPSALPGTIPMMFIATSFGFGIFYMGVFGSSLGVGSPGVFYTVSAISMIAIRLVSGRFMDKIAPIKIMGAAVICGLICYSMMLICSVCAPQSINLTGSDQVAQFDLEWLFYLAGIPYGLSLGVSLPINQTVAVRLSAPARWGAANGLYLLGNDIAIGLASFMFGFANDSFGFTPTLLTVMCFIALSFLAALICYPKDPRSHFEKSS